MALISVSPCVLYVFHHFLKSGERKLLKLFMSIFKLSWKKKERARLFENSYPCLLVLFSLRPVLHSVSRQLRAK